MRAAFSHMAHTRREALLAVRAPAVTMFTTTKTAKTA